MPPQNQRGFGMVVILFILGFFLVGGALAFWFWQTQDLSAIPFLFAKSDPAQLSGFWQPEKFFGLDPKTKKFKETPPRGQDANSYLEFKKSSVCFGGQVSEQGEPLPCKSYVNFWVDGNKITISGIEDQTTISGMWRSTNDKKLELMLNLPEGEEFAKIKVIFVKRRDWDEEKSARSPFFAQLQGRWKLEKYALFDQASGQFQEAEPPSESAGLYIEFKDDAVCTEGRFGEGGIPLPCSDYHKFNITADLITVADINQEVIWKWAISAGKLEIVLDSTADTPKKFALSRI